MNIRMNISMTISMKICTRYEYFDDYFNEHLYEYFNDYFNEHLYEYFNDYFNEQLLYECMNICMIQRASEYQSSGYQSFWELRYLEESRDCGTQSFRP